MHVLHLLYEPARSGISAHALGLVRLLGELRHGVIYPAHLQGLAEEVARAGGEPWPVDMGNKLLPRSALSRIPALVRRLRPDVLHVHALEAGAFGALAARLAGQAALVFQPQTVEIRQQRYLPAYRALVRGLLRRRALLLAVSQGQREDLQRFAPDCRVRVVPNWAPRLELGDRRDARARLGWGEEELVVAQITRLSAQKDPLTFVRAAAGSRAGLRWALFGDGPLRADVEDAAAGLARFDLPGFVPIAEVLAGADLLTLASRWEGMSLTLLGAMASGLPVVASRIAGNTDLVLHEQTGLLVEPGDAEGLRAAVERLARDAPLRARLAAAGRARVAEGYSEAAVAEQLRAAYREALESA